MGAPRLSACHILQGLCVLLILLEDGPQSTRASACPQKCPPDSSCINGTACRCNPGFQSSSGKTEVSRRDICEDIDECKQPAKVTCGNPADCHNTKGGFYCTCSPGYSLLSGETKFRNASENTCQDMDECQWNPGICKSRSICVNTHGSYTCTCLPGFELNPEDPKLCRDVNECTSGQKPCHKTTHCVNKVGSYRCHCRPGWKPVPGSPNGPNNTVCEDVDECTSGQNACHPTAQCHNTVGSYECRCRPGWKPVPGSPNGPNNTVCEQEIPFPTWTLPHGIKSQTLSNFFEKAQELGRDFKPASPRDTIQKFMDRLEELRRPGDLEGLALTERYRVATFLLSNVEEFLRTLATALPAGSFTHHSPSDKELSLMIKEQWNETDTLGQTQARMKLNWTQAAGAGDSGPTVAGIFSSRAMCKLLINASVELEPEKKAELEDKYESSVKGAHSTVLSTVNTVFLSNRDTKKLDPPVIFAFTHQLQTPKSHEELICAFWKGNASGGSWSTTGCRKLGSSENSITCECSHLSSFAILMAHYEVEDPTLTLITKLGLALSLVCLLLCILTFLLVRPIQGSRTTMHLHLCICLFLGSAIFLAGIENQGGQVGLRCRLVAGLLHYCFLAAFCWMSLEGLELYFLVVRVFQGQGLSKPWLYLIGYGVPFLIVAISAGVRPDGYGRKTCCWLKLERGFLWSFVGPVAFIILCNAVIFVITVWKLTQKFSEINPDMKKLKKNRVLTITAIAQLVVLGCTWVFGLFIFDPRNLVLMYAFTILNCLQGFFLFLLHCLLNKKVREEYQKWARMVTGNKYSDFATSTSSSSNNQTRVLRPSESGM
ncbi:adhesion G protein-coupled receptor E5 isoform X1 [Pipistrellus kuhlii]|uniref:adhesion G protein-coupled receptor E5 isoform X1 n=1 Tax=Pipistrellus kuhlii TaxID=59472 RepID=UPI00174F5BE4|nr:adhesion G protein-coupled receptor E5 isoform X1 [Pipistrellus kuhlii]